MQPCFWEKAELYCFSIRFLFRIFKQNVFYYRNATKKSSDHFIVPAYLGEQGNNYMVLSHCSNAHYCSLLSVTSRNEPDLLHNIIINNIPKLPKWKTYKSCRAELEQKKIPRFAALNELTDKTRNGPRVTFDTFGIFNLLQNVPRRHSHGQKLMWSYLLFATDFEISRKLCDYELNIRLLIIVSWISGKKKVLLGERKTISAWINMYLY